MLTRIQLLEIISGKRRGILAALTRLGLGCITPVYGLVINGRNRKFDRAIQENDQNVVKRAGIPVISVGNLTTGGTGKTPLVIWIAKWLREQNLRAVLISRGYTSGSNENQGRNDEAIEMEHRLPDVPHLQDADRFRMASIAVEELESQVIVLDDGFQHRKLHRDLDFVLIDATNPFGFGRLLPRGLLREPKSSLSRADLVVITRANLVSAQTVQEIESQIRQHSQNVPIAKTQTVFTKLLQSSGAEIGFSDLGNQPVFVFCGIGNPDNFKDSLEAIGINVCGTLPFPDHHEFQREDLQLIGEKAKQLNASAILCTHKDHVKVAVDRVAGIPLYAALIDVEFCDGEDKVTNMLEMLVSAV